MECWVRGEVWTESGEDASGPYYEAMDGILEVDDGHEPKVVLVDVMTLFEWVAVLLEGGAGKVDVGGSDGLVDVCCHVVEGD